MSNAIEITDQNFQTEVLESTQPVLIDCWATWCGPCRAIAPIIDELAVEYAGIAKVGKIDVDNNPEVSIKFGIRSIPMLLFFKNGQLVDTIVGLVPKKTISDKLAPLTATTTV